MKRRRRILALLVGALAAPLTGCHEEGTPFEPEFAQIEAMSAMEEAYLDELRAELIYLGVMADYGQVRPFSNIVNAEVRHSEAIARLYQTRGLALPSNPWQATDIPHFSSLTAACQAGVQAEIDNAAIYDRYLSLDLPQDVHRVFESNRVASLNNHLPAFQRCS